MKKIRVLLVLVLGLLLVACQSKPKENSPQEKTIGIIQFMSHPSLDQAREGFEEQVKKAKVPYKIDYKNAQGDVATAKAIADKFASDKVDLIYAIATPAAQSAQAATKEIPIIFSAVTDPVEAQLVVSLKEPGGNISGTSDGVDIKKQLELFKEMDPNMEKIGILYSADEANSLNQLEEAKKLAKDLGLQIREKSIQNLSDIPQTLSSMEGEIQGLYMLSDNKVSSSTSLVTERMKELKKPVVATVKADVDQGALISLGIDYLDLGKMSGQMAMEVLDENKAIGQIPVNQQEDFAKYINQETRKALGLDPNLKAFK